jgi:hypothetical protein
MPEHAGDAPEPTGEHHELRPGDVPPDHEGPHPEVERSGRSRVAWIGLAVALVAAVLLYVAIVTGIVTPG